MSRPAAHGGAEKIKIRRAQFVIVWTPDYGYGGRELLEKCRVPRSAMFFELHLPMGDTKQRGVRRRKSVFTGIANSDRRSQLRVCQTLLSVACGNIHHSSLLTAKDVSLLRIDVSFAAKRPLRRSERKDPGGKRRLFSQNTDTTSQVTIETYIVFLQ